MSNTRQIHSRPAVLVVGIALMLGLFLAGSWAAGNAKAHTQVAKVKPSGSAKTSIRTVVVTFTGVIRGGSIRVTGPRGRVVSSGRGGRDPRDVTRLVVPLKRGLKAGRYKASWKIVAADGHRQSGSFSFRLRR